MARHLVPPPMMATTPWDPCGAPTGDDAMDDLGKMLGSLGGGTGDTGGSPDLAAALGSLTGGEGGLEGLLAQLSNGGLGDEVGSGSGPARISPWTRNGWAARLARTR